jgi:hypothetical protein
MGGRRLSLSHLYVIRILIDLPYCLTLYAWLDKLCLCFGLTGLVCPYRKSASLELKQMNVMCWKSDWNVSTIYVCEDDYTDRAVALEVSARGFMSRIPWLVTSLQVWGNCKGLSHTKSYLKNTGILDFLHRPAFWRTENTTFRKLDLFPSSGPQTPTLLGLLE